MLRISARHPTFKIHSAFRRPKKKIYRTDTRELNVENICQASDVEDALCLPRAMLRTYPNVTLTNKMLDAHLYIFSRWVLDLIEVPNQTLNPKPSAGCSI
jgi:hypothetical protein